VSVLGETQVRIVSIRKLKTVVSAMRGIAAAHAQQARQSLGAYRAYAAVIADGLGRALELLPPDEASSAGPEKAARALVVFTAEHGLAGAFSERVLEGLGDEGGSILFMVGARGLALAEQRGWPAAWSGPMSSQASGVGATARQVADALYAGFVAGRFAGANVLFAKLSGSGDPEIVQRSILSIAAPFEPAAASLRPWSTCRRGVWSNSWSASTCTRSWRWRRLKASPRKIRRD
jgi:F-type H+-transporting ATPase subunit gamma